MTSQASILLVEDEPSIRQFLEMLLKDEGFHVVAAEHGRSALLLMSEFAPDLILLDMWMPLMDGSAFIKEYRNRPVPQAPIIAMSASNDVFDNELTKRIQDFLVKPFDVEVLLDCIKKHLP